LAADGKIVATNAAYAQALGYSPKELLGRRQEDLDLPASAQLFPERFQRILAGDILTFEVESHHRDGRVIPFEVSASLVSVGGESYVQSFVKDITERKRAEATLRLEGAALAATANAIVITNREGAIEWANAAFITYTGYRLDEVLGQTLRILKSGRQDRAFYQNLWDTILGGKVWHGELVNQRKDGSYYHEEMTITPLPDESGAITHSSPSSRTSPNGCSWRNSSGRHRRWRPWGCWPAGWRTISTTSWRSSAGMSRLWRWPAQRTRRSRRRWLKFHRPPNGQRG
jgi:PAS domain S-box-containing protein